MYRQRDPAGVTIQIINQMSTPSPHPHVTADDRYSCMQQARLELVVAERKSTGHCCAAATHASIIIQLQTLAALLSSTRTTPYAYFDCVLGRLPVLTVIVCMQRMLLLPHHSLSLEPAPLISWYSTGGVQVTCIAAEFSLMLSLIFSQPPTDPPPHTQTIAVRWSGMMTAVR